MHIPTLLFLCIAIALYFSRSVSTTEYAVSLASIKCFPENSTCNYQEVYEGRRDPLIRFWIMDPEDGAVKTLPITLRFGLSTTNTSDFHAYYANAHICVELNGRWKKCKAPGGQPISFRVLPEGNYTATAYFTDTAGEFRYRGSESVTFRVSSYDEYMMRNEMLAKKSREEQQFPEDVDILRWAEQMNVEPSEEDNLVLPRTRVSATNSPMLVIGVKTEVVESFPRRQAIRETWGNSNTLPHDVKVLFLGGDPNLDGIQHDYDRKRVLRAVAKERAAYRDLLTDELECMDSYRNLSNKVKSFMHLVAAEFPQAKFVMLVDDDVYLTVDQIAEQLNRASRARLYFGEVWSIRFSNRQAPIRDPSSPYYLPYHQYPMRGLLPYASGPHYAVSMDGIRFIAKNSWHLRSLNGLEDVSSGLWLRSIGINAEYSPDFSSIRSSLSCDDDLVSFADLSPLGIRSIHANLVSNRSFCQAFDSVTWHRHRNTIPRLDEMLQRPSYESKMSSTQLQVESFVDDSEPESVTVIISSNSSAGLKLQLHPSQRFESSIQSICNQVQLHFPNTSPSTCPELYNQLQLENLDPK